MLVHLYAPSNKNILTIFSQYGVSYHDLMISFWCCQGIYYYFYQVFKNKAEAIATANRAKGRGDGTVGIFAWIIVAAFAG